MEKHPRFKYYASDLFYSEDFYVGNTWSFLQQFLKNNTHIIIVLDIRRKLQEFPCSDFLQMWDDRQRNART